jgi:precorrin-8X/cobalt-precorrin-8 methylmutase
MELYKNSQLNVDGVVGVPVGFVGAAESKDALWDTSIPSIIAKGRRGGSTIGVAIVNAVMKEAVRRLEQ